MTLFPRKRSSDVKKSWRYENGARVGTKIIIFGFWKDCTVGGTRLRPDSPPKILGILKIQIISER